MNETGAKRKTPIHKKWWFWLIVILWWSWIAINIFVSGTDDTDTSGGEAGSAEASVSEQADTPKEDEMIEENAQEDPIEQSPFDRSLCAEFDYKEYLRNPGNYVGNPVKATVKVLQVLDGGLFDRDSKYYRCCAYNFGAQYLNEDYDRIYIVNDYREEGAEKILKDDILEVYGTFSGVKEATYALTGTKDEFPEIDMQESVRKN